jgi:hypothetical protein
MRMLALTTFLFIYLPMACPGIADETPHLEYPYCVIASFNPDHDCWTGMDVDGQYYPPVPVDPNRWLVGPPPSDQSAVTLPPDHWVELAFNGTLEDGPGPDILLTEQQTAGEQALVLVGDGRHSPYPLGIVTAGGVTEIEMDFSGQVLPFVPTRIRVVGLDTERGASSGFDLGRIRAGILPSQTPWATCPVPPHDACDIPPDVVLKWLPGLAANQHIVYFGKTLSEVEGGTDSVKKSQQPQDNTHFDPGPLELGQRYYWRVDEVYTSPSSLIQKGDVWAFDVARSRRIDDFEFVPFNWEYHEGSFIRTESSQSPDPVYEGCRAMAMHFNLSPNDHTGLAHQFNPPQDWSALGAEFIELALHGHPDNPQRVRFYLRLSDGQRTITLYNGDPNGVKDPQWYVWKIPLSSFSGLDLSQINRMVLGVTGDSPDNTWGEVYLDSIALYKAQCDEAQCRRADLNCDCRVDYRDLDQLLDTWLDSSHRKLIIKEPNMPVAWYPFEDDIRDSIGSVHGLLEGRRRFVEGRVGWALSLSGVQALGLPPDHVILPDAGRLFHKITKGLTIAFWQFGKDTSHVINTLVCSDLEQGRSNPAIHITLGCWDRPGHYQWQCGNPLSIEDSLYGSHESTYEWTGRWNHWTFAKDLRTGRMEIFLNGSLYATQKGLPSDLTEIQSLRIGNGWYGYYDGLYGYYEGLIDELRIYDYAIGQEEAAFLATEEGSGILDIPLYLRADLNGDDRMDWKDFAILAQDWLAGPVD